MSKTFQSEFYGDDSQDTVLEVRDLEVTYDMARGLARVLDSVNVEIKRGETFGVLGESGSGKSMFASSLMNAVQDPGVISGEIIYYPEDGEPIDLLDLSSSELKRLRWEEISMVYQGAINGFNPTLTIRTHFEETFDAHNVNREVGMEQAEETIRRLNLDPEHVLDAHAHDLSGGEKQRVMLALALVFDPEVLILDEPTSALDLLTQRNFLSLLYDIKDEYDLTLVFISHDIPIISGFADRIAVMYAFDIVERGEVHDVLLNADHPYTRMMLRNTLGMTTPRDEVQTIEGDTPDPIDVPLGCSFHPRCPIADDRCEVEEPELRSEEGHDHEVACFYPDIATEQLPVSLDEGSEEQ